MVRGVVRRTQPDWSWVGTEVTCLENITRAHRRRAAGLGGPGRPCRSALDDRTRSTDVDDDDSDRDNVSEQSVVLIKDPSCSSQRCKTAPRCYNHLGEKEWTAKGARDRYIESKLGPELKLRNGPAGLRNFGATCYANAFLQIWYYNISFRNGIFSSFGTSAGPASALYHLTNIFVMLRHSVKPVVDPGALIDALRLNKGDQQDAAEFSKLFMSLINDEFMRHPSLRTFISDQFEGTLQYETRCNTCNYISSTSCPFLELEISLVDNTSLSERIQHLLSDESLDGANCYRCPRCDDLRPATRSTYLQSLPPVLHFSLLRFVYDPKSESRKKSKASISYPSHLRLEGRDYELRGVVNHFGRSAMHGHFACEVFDEESGIWYLCNDEEVTEVTQTSDRSQKRRKLDLESVEKSRDAYMLVYKQVGAIVPSPSPDALLTTICKENAELEETIASRESQRKIFGEEFDRLWDDKLQLLRVLPGEECIVPRDELVAFIKSKDDYPVFDLSSIKCDHGAVDPEKTADVRLISREAFSKLRERSAIPDLDICQLCVEESFTHKVNCVTHAEKVAEFDRLNHGEGFAVPKLWLKAWRANTLENGVIPTDPLYSLYCKHHQPWGNKRQNISPEALTFLRSIIGPFDAFADDAEQCLQCDVTSKEEARTQSAWLTDVKMNKLIFNRMRNITEILNSTNYVIPRRFFNEWKEYIQSPGQRPNLELELCCHGLIDFDPQMEQAEYLNATGWNNLCKLYSHDPTQAISVIFRSLPEPGKRFAVSDASIETCQSCRRSRLSTFDALDITVVVGLNTIPSERRSTKSRGQQTRISVTKMTTVKDIRVQLYAAFKVSPICQKLYYKERELDSAETIESIGFLVGDHLNLMEVIEVGDFEDVVLADEGFGGTALIGRIACPACTFSNEPGSKKCEMCETIVF